MLLTRTPPLPLRPFVKRIWTVDGAGQCDQVSFHRERVLPTGTMHLVFFLSEHSLRLFDDVADNQGHSVGNMIIGGARSAPYLRAVSESTVSVGAQFLPGASELLFGVHANALAERHTKLDDVWSHTATDMRDRLLEAGSAQHRMDLFESLLMERLPRVHGLHPAVAHALARFEQTNEVRQVVRQTGYSHRRFIELFTRAVGLTPKLYCRVSRFQSVLNRIADDAPGSWVDVAMDSGYSDQPHFVRQFKEFSGVTPTEYEQLSPRFPNHVPVLPTVAQPR
jgi:AraC-like DNA-binding protein